MKSVIKRICELQPAYSALNTSAMKERGQLIRSDLANEIRLRLPALQAAFDNLFDDLAVEGSDGIGRKTEAPWVRLYSEAMSPNPRNGFYIVIHFSADGSAFFITIGCGSTIWSGGDLRAVSNSELKKKTAWARSIVAAQWGSLEPFNDSIFLGARASLPRTFEKATALAKRVEKESIDNIDIDHLLYEAASRLSAIYLAQLEQRDISPGEQAAAEVESISKPLRKRGAAQGFGLTASERQSVERHAMLLATEFLEREGFHCSDKSAEEPYDILATQGSDSVKVEVKGTTSDLCESIFMTRNEVSLHRKEKGSTGLIIVSQIRLNRSGALPVSSGGKVEALLRWDIDKWIIDSIAFQVSRA